MLFLKQLLSYGVLGVAINLLAYGLYLLLTYGGLEPKLTMTMLYLTGATVSFFANRRLTFGHRASVVAAGARYVLAHCGGYLINLLMLLTLTDVAGYPHWAVQALAVGVVACFLFFALKLFVFRDVSQPSGGA